MLKDYLELYAVPACWALLLLSTCISFWRAYRAAEKGREKWLHPVLLTVLWQEAVVMTNCWEQTGNLVVLPFFMSGFYAFLRHQTWGLECLGGFILLALALLLFYFKEGIIKRRKGHCLLIWAIVLQTALLMANVLAKESYILQSLGIGFIMLIALCCTGRELLRLKNQRTRSQWIVSVLSALLSICFVAGALPYLNPFDRQVEFTLFAKLELPYTLSEQKWECVYDRYGIYPGSQMYSSDGPASDVGWPDGMDMTQFSYIVCYGAEIDSLSFNIWDTENLSIVRGAYNGKVAFGNENYPNHLFVYQIGKMRLACTYGDIWGHA